MNDPRITPQPDILQDTGGSTESTVKMSIAVPVADLCRAANGPRDRQVLYGETFKSYGVLGDWTYGKTSNTGYMGFLRSTHLAPLQNTNARIVTPWGHVYPTPNFKDYEVITLPFGAQVDIGASVGKFYETTMGYIPMSQVSFDAADDPAQIALSFLGAPYLWGGNSPAGLDCSGLVQAAYLACGLSCYGDSDLMEQYFQGDTPIAPARNQLYFWKGHVALTISETEMVHANANAMAVTIENIEQACERILAAGGGPITRKLQIPI